MLNCEPAVGTINAATRLARPLDVVSTRIVAN
jgi:hypothetical protein